jgi:hypothetical protein
MPLLVPTMPDQPVSPRATQARSSALEADPVLGKPLGNYVSDRFRLLWVAAAVVLPIGLILFFTVGMIEEAWGPPLMAALSTALALGAGWGVLHLWNREIILYERGFTVGEGARVVPIRYDEIAGVRLRAERVAYLGGLIRHTRTRFTLTTAQDEQIIISQWYRRADELGTRLTALADAALRPQIEARWAQGEAVAFAEGLSLSAMGVHSGDEVLDWGDYGGYAIGGGQLTILGQRDAAWVSVPLATLDNATLLMRFLRERRPD